MKTPLIISVALEKSGGEREQSVSEYGSLTGKSFNKVGIHKHFAPSPRVFSKATGMMSVACKSVSPVNNVEILSLCLYNRKKSP